MNRATVVFAAAGFGALLAGALAASSPTSAPDANDAVQRLVDAGLASDGAYRKLAWLTDRIGPRLSGSENLEKAVAWCAAEMNPLNNGCGWCGLLRNSGWNWLAK